MGVPDDEIEAYQRGLIAAAERHPLPDWLRCEWAPGSCFVEITNTRNGRSTVVFLISCRLVRQWLADLFDEGPVHADDDDSDRDPQ